MCLDIPSIGTNFLVQRLKCHDWRSWVSTPDAGVASGDRLSESVRLAWHYHIYMKSPDRDLLESAITLYKNTFYTEHLLYRTPYTQNALYTWEALIVTPSNLQSNWQLDPWRVHDDWWKPALYWKSHLACGKTSAPTWNLTAENTIWKSSWLST